MHINATAASAERVLELARAQLDSEIQDKALVEILFGYVEQRINELPAPGGRVYEITADVNIDVQAYLRIP